MASLQEKLQKLEDATNLSQAIFLDSQSKLEHATKALKEAEAKLRDLNPEAQQALQVNDTELPELLEAKYMAETECEGAKKRYETNQKYLVAFKAKVATTSAD